MELVETLVNGVLLGSLYGVIGMGLSLNFGIMRVVNLAYGDVLVLAAYLSWLLLPIVPSPFLTLVVVLPVLFAVGFALQRLIIARTLGRGVLPPLMVTFGISVVLQNLMLEGFTPNARTLPTPLATASVALGPLSLSAMYVVDFAAAVLLALLLWLALARTALGRAFRATSDDPEMTQLLGLDPRFIGALAAGASAALAGMAGVLLGTTFTFYPTTGSATLLVAFETVVIGGLGSLWGTLVGGIALGVAQLMGSRYFGPGYGLMAGHLMFLAVLMLRPQGLFPQRSEG